MHWANASTWCVPATTLRGSSTTCATGRAFWSWTRPRRWYRRRGGGESLQGISLRSITRQVRDDPSDKNHPCVVWATAAGRMRSTSRRMPTLAPAVRLALSWTREPPMPRLRLQTTTKDITTRTMNVSASAAHGWYNLSGDMDAACYGLNQEMDCCSARNPFLIRKPNGNGILPPNIVPTP